MGFGTFFHIKTSLGVEKNVGFLHSETVTKYNQLLYK